MRRADRHHVLRRWSLLVVLLVAASPLAAQPFGAWLVSTPGHPTTHGYAQIPSSPALNPTAAFTIEFWFIESGSPSGCRSLVGKNFEQTWWTGVCGDSGSRTLRSYLKGGLSQRNGGRIPSNQWTHIAVVFNGVTRRHYIDGELVMSVAESGPLPTNGAEVRIFSDVAFERSPSGSINEVRLWNVARTQAQLRANINRALGAQPGLVALWRTGATDVVGPHDGVIVGTGVGILTFPVATDCGASTTTSLCLQTRFSIRAKFRVGAPGTAEGVAQTVPCGGCVGSGIFWFFNVQNWELMIKAINGCVVNDRFWIFNAGLTNLFFRIEALDVVGGAQKIYFNYPGPPAPAITDIDAFAICP
jgi:hypothetical protein